MQILPIKRINMLHSDHGNEGLTNVSSIAVSIKLNPPRLRIYTRILEIIIFVAFTLECERFWWRRYVRLKVTLPSQMTARTAEAMM